MEPEQPTDPPSGRGGALDAETAPATATSFELPEMLEPRQDERPG